MSGKSKVIVVVLVLAALALVLGAVVFPWWTGVLEGGHFEIDLRNMTMCINKHCGSPKALAASDASAAPWAKVGIATMAASFVAAVLAAGVAMRISLGGRLGVLPWLAGVLAGFTGVLGILFASFHPEFGDWTPSYGMACTFAGALAAAAMSVIAGVSARSKAS